METDITVITPHTQSDYITERVYITSQSVYCTESIYITSQSVCCTESIYIKQVLTPQKVITLLKLFTSQCLHHRKCLLSALSYLEGVPGHFFLQLVLCETLADESLRIVDSVLWVMFCLFSSSVTNQNVFASTNHILM